MRRGLFVAGMAAALAILPGSGAATARLPIEAYGHLPSVDDMAISPDGSHIAVMVASETMRQVEILRTGETLQRERVLNIGTAKLRSMTWAGSDHLILLVTMTAAVVGVEGPKREWTTATDYDLRSGKVKPLLGATDRGMNAVIGRPVVMRIGGHMVAFLKGFSFPGQRGIVTLFRQNLDSGAIASVAVGNEQTRDFLVDDTGHVAAREDYNDESGLWQLYTRRGSGLTRSAAVTAPLDPPSLIGFGGDRQSVIVSATEGGHHVYHEVPLGADQWSGPISAMTDSDLMTPSVNRTAIGYLDEGMMAVRYHFLAPADQTLWDKIVRAFPHDVVRLESWSDDRHFVVLKVEGQSGAAYYLLDATTRHASWIADEYEGIGAAETGPVSAISYKAQDGLTIPAYLTLPPGAAPRHLPLVVLVHGGPAARDAPGFDWWAQALASRGYAVLQPQYRGSEGFGMSLFAAGFGEWGRRMQTDVSDGVRHLAAEGIVDPARVCIVGGSYGGYAALAGVTLESGVYRCAVSLAGPSDLRRFLSWERDAHSGASGELMRYWQRFVGTASISDPKLDAISPLRQASKASVPILLIHGSDDTVVPIEQSQIMADALARAGHPAQLVRLRGEDHWLSRSQTRIEMLRAIDSFLATNLPVDTARIAAAP